MGQRRPKLLAEWHHCGGYCILVWICVEWDECSLHWSITLSNFLRVGGKFKHVFEFWTHICVFVNKYREDAHEYAGQSRAAVLAAGNQRLERQNTRQQQQGQFDNSSRQPRQFSLTQEGIHRSNYRQHLPSRYGNDGRRLPTSSSNTIVDGDDSSDEDIYRFESLSHQRSFSRDQLGRW